MSVDSLASDDADEAPDKGGGGGGGGGAADGAMPLAGCNHQPHQPLSRAARLWRASSKRLLDQLPSGGVALRRSVRRRAKERLRVAVELHKSPLPGDEIRRAVFQKEGKAAGHGIAARSTQSILRMRLSRNAESRELRLALGYIVDARAGRPLRLTRLDGLPYQLYVLSTLPAYDFAFTLLVLLYVALSRTLRLCTDGAPRRRRSG